MRLVGLAQAILKSARHPRGLGRAPHNAKELAGIAKQGRLNGAHAAGANKTFSVMVRQKAEVAA
jgi:hypothetical protein